jgi:hypothetical protein
MLADLPQFAQIYQKDSLVPILGVSCLVFGMK